MTSKSLRGVVFRCPVCGAEIVVLADSYGEFAPVCCNVAMVDTNVRLRLFVCPVCRAEVAIIREGGGEFVPRCCNTAMVLVAA